MAKNTAAIETAKGETVKPTIEEHLKGLFTDHRHLQTIWVKGEKWFFRPTKGAKPVQRKDVDLTKNEEETEE